MANALCWLDGRVVPAAEARVSPLDRGFLFGDAVYEALKVVAGEILFLAPHLARLARSLERLRIPPPPGVAAALAELIEAAALESGSLYLQITRGAAPARSHRPPPGIEPTLFALATPLEFAPEPWALPGLAAITRPDDRWEHRDIKTTSLAASVLGKLEAAERDADEALFVDPHGALREGGNTSLLVRGAGGWHTHPLGSEILPGVTRAVLFAEARAAGFTIEERAPRLAERAGWSEALLCGTLTGVRGLVRLDGAPVGDGEVGPGTRELARRLADAEAREAAAQRALRRGGAEPAR